MANLFKAPAPPPLIAPPPMPNPNDPASIAAGNAANAKANAFGRSSTTLTTAGTIAGGGGAAPTYSGSKLGGR